MMREFVDLDWADVTEAVPAVLTAILMPFTYSIANGLAFGFISYAVLKLLSGRAREASPLLYVLGVLFVLRYALL